MSEFLQQLGGAWEKLTLITVIDIAAVAILIYQFLSNIRGRRAAQIVLGLAMLVSLYGFAVWFGFQLLSTLLAALAPYTAFALIVVFQSEIRRVLARLGRRKILGFGDRLERYESAEEILLAMEHLAQHHIGALIVVERESGLRSIIESGVALESLLRRDLLISIFLPRGPMHDGAVIIQGDRVAAAACFLPLTINPQMNSLGTRHRAAIGVTEESDCLALIVSEETGHVSYAQYGELHRNVTLGEIERMLTGRRTPTGRWKEPAAQTSVPAGPVPKQIYRKPEY
ncbi:MAG: diadenylate cyclase CdaA [Acidobacteria bacterium]|nr:diadenylate cyclase CdaA [Acidobacteriota bacterium]